MVAAGVAGSFGPVVRRAVAVAVAEIERALDPHRAQSQPLGHQAAFRAAPGASSSASWRIACAPTWSGLNCTSGTPAVTAF